MMDSKLEQFASGISFILQNAPSYFFIKDLDSHYVDLSQSIENDWGIKRKMLIGSSDYGTPWDAFADQYRHYDNLGKQNGYSDVFEPFPLNESLVVTTRCVRFPIRGGAGEILGVMGQTQIFSSHANLSEALRALMKIDKKNFDFPMQMHPTYQVKQYPEALQLTSRESECIFLLVRGKTAKEIGLFLQISPRTVESHIENIKIKLSASSRSEIIAKAIDLGLLDIIPKQEILSNLYNHPDKWKQFLF